MTTKQEKNPKQKLTKGFVLHITRLTASSRERIGNRAIVTRGGRTLLAETQYRSNVGSSRSVPIVRTRLAMVAV